MTDRTLLCDACGAPARDKPQAADTPIGRCAIWSCSEECLAAELVRREGRPTEWKTKSVKAVLSASQVDGKVKAGVNRYRVVLTKPDGTRTEDLVDTKIPMAAYTAAIVADWKRIDRNLSERPRLEHGHVEVSWWDDRTIRLERRW